MNLILTLGVVVAALTGAVVLNANPFRGINRIFFILSVAAIFWLLTLAQLVPTKPNILFWVRLANAQAAMMPWMFWMLKDTVNEEVFGIGTLRRGWIWGVVAAGLVVLCFTNYFIPAESTPRSMLVGRGRVVFNVVIGIEYLILLGSTVREVRSAKGIRRIELQFLMLNGAGAGLAALLLNSLSVWFGLPELRRLEPLLIVGFFGTTAWAITSLKVFEARQLLRAFFRRLQVTCAIAAVVWVAIFVSDNGVSRLVPIACTALILVFMIDLFIRADLLGSGVDRATVVTRRKLIAAGSSTDEWSVLEESYAQILREWGHSEYVGIHVVAEGFETSHPLPESLVQVIESETEKDGWVTPEKIERTMPTPLRRELGKFMRENKVGVIVSCPRETGTLPTLVLQGARYDLRPFTFQDVQFLRDCAGLIESQLSRFVLTQRARDSERLATAGMLGASLAHEIRNPLVTIKSVVQQAKSRFSEPGFQRLLIEVLPGEITRIEGLVTGLMDLSRPRHPSFDRLHLNDLVRACLLLVTPRAKERDVKIIEELDANPDELSADRSAVQQVVLNLVMNAIDAFANVEGPRLVTIRTSNLDRAICIEIGDNGPGLSIETQRTLFRPFTKSTKSTGMGLGLAICADIVRSHHGEIKFVDDASKGALFRITLPCQQP